MSEITLLAVISTASLATQLRAYMQAYQPRFQLHVVPTSAEALALMRERQFDTVWFEYHERATGLAEVAMMFAPGELIALVNDHEEAASSLDQGATSIVFRSDDLSAWPTSVRLTEVAIGREAQLRALQLTEQRFEAAIRGAHLGLWYWSVAHRTLAIDERWRRILGYTRGEELKTGDVPWVGLTTEEHEHRTREAIQKCLSRTSDFFSLDIPLTGPNGLERTVLVVGGVPHRTKRGEPIQMAGVLFDLNQRQGSLGNVHPHLSGASIAEGIAANKVLDNLVRETRTQLSTIIGYGDMIMLDESIPTTCKEAAAAILTSARALLKTTQQANSPASRLPL